MSMETVRSTPPSAGRSGSTASRSATSPCAPSAVSTGLPGWRRPRGRRWRAATPSTSTRSSSGRPRPRRGAPGGRTAERAAVPYVLSPRGMLVPELIRTRGRWRKLAWLALAERRTIERAAVLHATSALEAEEAARLGFPLPPVAVVPNGIDPEPWDGDLDALSPPVREVVEGAPFLLFLGRLSWKKGLDRLIPALAEIPGAL